MKTKALRILFILFITVPFALSYFLQNEILWTRISVFFVIFYIILFLISKYISKKSDFYYNYTLAVALSCMQAVPDSLGGSYLMNLLYEIPIVALVAFVMSLIAKLINTQQVEKKAIENIK